MVGCRCLQAVYINRTTDSRRSTADARARVLSYMTDKDEAHQFPIQFAGPVFRTLASTYHRLAVRAIRLTGGSSVLRELSSISLTKSSPWLILCIQLRRHFALHRIACKRDLCITILLLRIIT